jgi:hypothetical protein
MAAKLQLNTGSTSRLALALAAALLMAGCGGTQFAGNSGKKPGAVVPSKNTPGGNISAKVRVGCDSAASTTAQEQSFTGGAGTTVALSGDFCGQGLTETSSEQLTVLFVFDFSGSMLINDPTTSGSCGRLQAAQTILAKLEAEPATSQAKLNLAMQAFGSHIMPGIAPTTIAAFKPQLNAQSVCRSDGNATNYEAAFTAASDLLGSLKGRKVIYFISDGLPTVSGTNQGAGGLLGVLNSVLSSSQSPAPVYDAGTAAAAKLRAQSDVTLNVIYLGSAGTAAEGPVPAGLPDPQTYLRQIAGSADHLRVVSSAQELASQIATFSTPVAASGDIVEGSVQVTLSAANHAAQDFKVASITKDPTQPNLWHYTTVPMPLFGSYSQVVDNTIKVSIRGLDGKINSTTAIVHFTQQ